jgi:chorismate dehydratase
LSSRPVRLGAVGYLNAKPLVYGLAGSPRFDVRFDVPARCADLLHEGTIDVGLIPSIEYVNGDYRIVPDLAIASCGPVASVAIYTTRPMRDVRSIALDTSSRTSVALVKVLCARVFRIQPALERHGPELGEMLAEADAALLIGDNALVTDGGAVRLLAAADGAVRRADPLGHNLAASLPVEKLDLGAIWTEHTGLPFVYAFWAGRAGALGASDLQALKEARDRGIEQPDAIARDYFAGAPEHHALGARYLRDNIKYFLGADERAGLERFYAYAAEAGVVPRARALAFYE